MIWAKTKALIAGICVLLIVACIVLTSCAGTNENDDNTIPVSEEIAQPEAIEEAEEYTNDPMDANDTVEEMLVRISASTGLRMREGPGTEYDIIKVIAVNEFVEKLEHNNSTADWIYINYDGDNGWVNTEFIEYVSAADIAKEAEANAITIANWAKIYYDFFSNEFNIGDYMSMYGEMEYYAHTVKGEKRLLKQAYFHQINGFDYPVMVLSEFALENDNYTISSSPGHFNAYLIKDGSLTTDLIRKEFDSIFYAYKDGPGWLAHYGGAEFTADINGKRLFFRDLYDGEGLSIDYDNQRLLLEQNLQIILSWLSSQTQ